MSNTPNFLVSPKKGNENDQTLNESALTDAMAHAITPHTIAERRRSQPKRSTHQATAGSNNARPDNHTVITSNTKNMPRKIAPYGT